MELVKVAAVYSKRLWIHSSKAIHAWDNLTVLTEFLDLECMDKITHTTWDPE